jgi:AcrR family transcriptional regulator
MSDRGRPRSFDRDKALQKAVEVFWARGYAGASVAELTQAMGIAAPSLYAAFGGKADLYREAVALYSGDAGEDYWLRNDRPTARETLDAYLRDAAAGMTSPDRPRGCMIMLSAAQPCDMSPDLYAELKALRCETVTRIETRLARAQEAGEIGEGVNLSAVARFYATVHQGMSLQAREGATTEALLGVVDVAMAGWEAATRRPTPQA